MHTNCSFLRIAGRAAAFTFLMAGTASLMQAQQAVSAPSSAPAPLLLASSSPSPATFSLAPDAFSSSGLSSSSSLSSDSSDALAASPSSFSSDLSQPPPRRRYGRPNYADSHTNADGSNKFAFMVGGGLATPVQDTGKYLTPNFSFQVGAGRNWSKKFGVLVQFDYNKFGFQGSTLANQENLYNTFCTPFEAAAGACTPITGLDGTSHVWSFTLDPTYTFYSGDSYGAYLVAGVGFYHKTANFFVPSTQEACSFYGCFDYSANETVDDYSSNAPGFNGGFGMTYKPSRFAGERFYVEARYVFVDNSNRAESATNLYPPNANQTYYFPVTLGLRF
jgi:hypothetical protein